MAGNVGEDAVGHLCRDLGLRRAGDQTNPMPGGIHHHPGLELALALEPYPRRMGPVRHSEHARIHPLKASLRPAGPQKVLESVAGDADIRPFEHPVPPLAEPDPDLRPRLVDRLRKTEHGQLLLPCPVVVDPRGHRVRSRDRRRQPGFRQRHRHRQPGRTAPHHHRVKHESPPA